MRPMRRAPYKRNPKAHLSQQYWHEALAGSQKTLFASKRAFNAI